MVPSLERVREVLSYDPDTGLFVWVAPTSNRVRAGSIAGTPNGVGYIRISIDGQAIYAHRLAWYITTGEMPAGEVDHRDGDRSNNRISNLRLATHSENAQNQGRKSTNKSGHIGVSWSQPHGKWAAYIHHGGKKRHLGLFSDAREAGAAYLSAKAKLHVFQPVPRDVVAA